MRLGLTGKIDSQGNYNINFSNFGKELGLMAFITYDYEYDLPRENDNGN